MTGAFAVAAGLGLLAAPGALLPSVPSGRLVPPRVRVLLEALDSLRDRTR